MAKARPKTGERREKNQPLKIDRLPPAVHEAILKLYNEGKTWLEIEALSAEPVGNGQMGFVEWEKLPTPVLELFPEMRIAHSTLHRWHDLRVRQVKAQVMEQSVQAREIAEAFAKATVEGQHEAVLNAARDQILSLLAEGSGRGDRLKIAAKLTELGSVMQKARTNDIRERKVAVDEQTLQLKLDEIKRRTGELLQDANGDPAENREPLTRDELLARVKELYGVA